MALATLADYQAAPRQRILYSKGGASWGGSTYYANVRIGGGATPAASAPANTTSGIVPTSALTGFPAIASLGSAMYITGVEASLLASSSTYGGIRFLLADLLWYAGTYTSSATVTLSGQPSFSSRIVGGSYGGLQLWLEGNHGSQTSGSNSYVVTYTNQDGTAGQSTASFSPDFTGSNVGLEAVQIGLASGDTGIQKVESVIGTGAGQRSIDLMIVRPLVYGRVTWGRRRSVQRYWIDSVGMPQIFSDSALTTIVCCEGSPSTLSTAPMELYIEIVGA